MAPPKGKTNNPKGRPAGILSPQAKVGWVGVMDVRLLAKEWTHDAIKTLAEIMNDKAANPSARVAAAQNLLDRGWGKSAQIVEATVNHYDRMTDDELKLLVEGTVIATGPNSGRIELEEVEEELPE